MLYLYRVKCKVIKRVIVRYTPRAHTVGYLLHFYFAQNKQTSIHIRFPARLSNRKVNAVAYSKDAFRLGSKRKQDSRVGNRPKLPSSNSLAMQQRKGLQKN